MQPRLSYQLLLLVALMLGVVVLAGVALAPVAAQGNCPPTTAVLAQDTCLPPAASLRVYLPLVAVPRTSGVSSPTSLVVNAASQIGGSGADKASAVDVAPDGTVVFGGTLPGYTPPGISPITLLNGSDGLVLRLDQDGQLRSATRLGASISDLEVSPSGTILACGDFGVAALSPDAASLVWNAAIGAGQRCAIGTDETSAVLAGNEVAVFAADGSALGRWPGGGGVKNDLAVDGQRAQVIVTGYTQVSKDLQVAFIRAYSYDGSLRWRSYDFPTTHDNLRADTRGERIAIGRDGKLYFAGSINGGTGASIFVSDPKDIELSATERIVVTDRYTNSYSTSTAKILWIGRFAPATGALELGQTILTRLSDDKGNSIGATAITADSDGAVYVAGSAAASIASRDLVTINGRRLGAYGGDAYALITAPDFKQRRLWVAFTDAQGGKGGNGLIAVRGDTVAFGATINEGAFISHNAVQPAPGGGGDAYVAIWVR
jgi:hypothetical protein